MKKSKRNYVFKFALLVVIASMVGLVYYNLKWRIDKNSIKIKSIKAEVWNIIPFKRIDRYCVTLDKNKGYIDDEQKCVKMKFIVNGYPDSDFDLFYRKGSGDDSCGLGTLKVGDKVILYYIHDIQYALLRTDVISYKKLK